MAKLKRFGSKRELANKPHRAMGQWAKGARFADPGGGEHVTQRVTGFNDRKGYREGATPNIGRESGKAPRYAREHGYYHPISTQNPTRGYDQDVARSGLMGREVPTGAASARRDGFHTGKASRGDSNIRKGAEGNGQGSAPPGVGKGQGRRGTPDSHLGTAGRGGTGKFGKGDSYKGKPTNYSEEPGHNWFEKLGSD